MMSCLRFCSIGGPRVKLGPHSVGAFCPCVCSGRLIILLHLLVQSYSSLLHWWLHWPCLCPCCSSASGATVPAWPSIVRLKVRAYRSPLWRWLHLELFFLTVSCLGFCLCWWSERLAGPMSNECFLSVHLLGSSHCIAWFACAWLQSSVMLVALLTWHASMLFLGRRCGCTYVAGRCSLAGTGLLLSAMEMPSAGRGASGLAFSIIELFVS